MGEAATILVLDDNAERAELLSGQVRAIFLHVAHEGYAPTAGCVALALPDLLNLLADCTPGDVMEILDKPAG